MASPCRLIRVISEVENSWFLPVAKYDVRAKRLAGYTNLVASYHTLHPDDIPSRGVVDAEEVKVTGLFSSKSVHPSLTKLPAAPFLVPATLDALLQDSDFKDLVEVVPGEADLYCSSLLKNEGGIVLTGDSDLLVHDLEANGAVSFFRDIDLSVNGITSSVYEPAAIAKRLRLPSKYGLRALAFELVMDSHKSFRQLLQRALVLKSINEHNAMYETFSSEYETLSLPQNDLNGVQVEEVTRLLKKLDPRISEYIRQFPYFGSGSQQIAASKPSSPNKFRARDIHIFLPFLHDCPTRTSAWEMSTHIRQLAYGLVNLVVPQSEAVSNVIEHRRQQRGSRGRSWQLPSLDEVPAACEALSELIRQVRARLSPAAGMDLWRILAICQDLEWAHNNSKPSLCQKVCESSGARNQARSWDHTHLEAQIQGSYYSYRILKQILDLVTACQLPPPESIRELQTALNDLPPLMFLSDSIHLPDTVLQNDLLTELKSVLGIEEPQATILSVSSKAEKKKMKKRKRDGLAAEADNLSKKATNPFSLLESDC
jgi:hypothetical protein